MFKEKNRLRNFYVIIFPLLFSTIVFAQTPGNDMPCNATLLTVGSSCTYANYNSTGATANPSVPQPTGTNCAGWGAGRDVWFRAVVPANGAVTVSANQANIFAFGDGVMAAYRGTSCNSLTLIKCDDDGGPGLMPQISLMGETPGTTIWFRFWRHNNDNVNTGGLFQLCASNAIPNTQDCLGAIPLCQNSYTTATSYTGTGNVPDEINTVISCLKDGERNDVWYTFTVQTSGNVNFTITPNNLSNDYDWAVFNLTNANCSDIATNASLQVSCNYSETAGATGISTGSAATSQGYTGTPFNAPIPVTAGQTYVVNVSNFSSTAQSGYTINFAASTATILDNVGPRLLKIDTVPACGQNRIAFSMNENVMCNTVQAGDFSLTGPGGAIPITSVTSVYCQFGTTYDNTFRINTSTGFTQTGTYTLCLTNTAGNISDLCGNLSVSTSPCLTFSITEITLNTSKTDVVCKGASTGTASVTASGAGGGYTYLWSNSATTAAINGLPAGTYTVTVTSGQCTKTASVTVNEPALGITTATTSTPSNCGQTDGSATVTPSNGAGTYTYLWNNSQTNATATNLAAGNYTVTVRDANNCSAIATATVSNQNSTLALTVRGDTACSGVGQGRAYVTATGGTPGYTYTWSNAQTTDTIKNLANGVYTVTVRDAVNCSVTASTGVLRYPAITFNAPATTPTNCGQSDGMATVNPTGGGGGFTYIWSNSQTSQTATNLVAGSYDVTVRDVNNCTATSTIVVANQGSTLAITLKGDTACDNPSATKIFVTATGGSLPYTYLWSNGLITDTIESIPNGTYSVTVRDASNCTVTGSTGVLRYAPITFNPSSSTNATCGLNNGTATINPTGGSGGFTYTWSDAQTAQTATGLAAGAYSVTVRDANNCSATANVSVPNQNSTLAISLRGDTACGGVGQGRAFVTATGGTSPYTILWSNNQTADTIQNLANGVYSVTVTDGLSCSVIASTNVLRFAEITFNAPTIVVANCNQSNGSATVNPSGGSGSFTYLWSNSETTQTIGNLVAGVYDVTVTDVNSCTATTSVTVTQDGTPIITNTSQTDVTCFGGNDGTATITASGGAGSISYSWSNGQTNATATNLAAGSYTVSATDFNNCPAIFTFTIVQPQQIVFVSAVFDIPSCFGSSDGSITVNFSGGTGALNYAWNNSQTGNTASSLAAGIYTVTATDANGCTAPRNITLDQPAAVAVTVSTTPALCFGQASGTASALGSGGTLPYTFQWSAGSYVSDFNGQLPQGNYVVSISDANGCSSTQNFSVTEPAQLLLSAVSTPVSCANSNDGTVAANPAGSTQPFTFDISGNGIQQNNTTGLFENLPVGDYTLLVTNVNNCTAQTQSTVAQAQEDAFDVATDSTTCFGDVYRDGKIIVTALFPQNGAYYYSLDGINYRSKPMFDSLGYGNYQVFVKSEKGCESTLAATVFQPEKLEAVITPATLEIALGEGGTVNVAANNRYGISYEWSPITGLSCSDCASPAISPFTETEYVLTIKDSRDGKKFCTAKAELLVVVGEHGEILIPNLFSPNGDGVNDVFAIFGNNIREVSLKIFNRWGEKVFEADNIYNGWDGTFKTIAQPSDVYTYTADIVFLNNKKLFKSGTVTLVR